MAKYARDKLARLEEVAARHERLAREYGYRAPLKRPESDANPGDAPKIGPDGRREETRAAGPR